MNLMRRLILIAAGKPSPDTSRPSVVVTSNAVQPVATGTFTATFTFSEVVTGFVLGDITVTGGAASSLNTSDNRIFTATITPTFLTDLTIQVLANVCQDIAGNLNTASNALAVVATYPIGSVHSDNFNSTSLAAYTQNGSTMSAATGDLVLNGGSGVFTNYLLLNTPNVVSGFGTNCLEKWVMQVLFTCPSGSPFGFGIGIRSNNGPEQFDNIIRLAFDAAQEAKQGTVYYYSAQNHSASPSQTVATIGATFTLVVGTDYIFEIERDKNVFTARLKSADGVTTHKTYTSFTYNQTSVNAIRAHNRGQFGVWNFQTSSLPIKQYTITSKALKNPAILTIEDSNGSLYAGANTSRTTEQVATALSRSFEEMWGINAELPDMTAIVPSALALAHPTYTKVYVNGGSNDRANGQNDATTRTRLATLVTTLTSGGLSLARIIIGTPGYRNGLDLSVVRANIITDYTATNPISDEHTATAGAGTNMNASYNIGDNIHYNTAGHTARVSVRQTALT